MDLIDRHGSTSKMFEICDMVENELLHIDVIIDALENLPSAEQRKKGKWVGADSQCGIGCPFCGTPVDDFCSSIDYIDLSYEPNFCHNCGADMRGEQE